MLKLFLWLKYLRKRRIVLLSIAAVALSVALLIVVAGAGCSPEELRKDVVETQAGAAGETAPGTSAGAAAPVLTQKEADAVLALAASKSEAVNRPEDVTPEAIAKLENTVITSDYVANFGRSNATILADESLPAEALAIAVLKILESNRVPIHMIVGTSAGSLVGSLYAYGFNAFQLQSLSFPVEKGDIVDLTVPDNGFIKGEKLEAFVNRMLKDTPIEKLRTPFYAVATDIQTGEEIVFASGNTGTAVRASCSVPGIFQPVRIGSRIYVDGGIVSPVPVDYARKKGADLVIAVDISMGVESPPPKTLLETIMQSVVIMYSRIAQNQLGRADIVIRPEVSHIGPLDFTKRHEAVLEGEKAALEAMPQVKASLDRLRAEGRL